MVSPSSGTGLAPCTYEGSLARSMAASFGSPHPRPGPTSAPPARPGALLRRYTDEPHHSYPLPALDTPLLAGLPGRPAARLARPVRPRPGPGRAGQAAAAGVRRRGPDPPGHPGPGRLRPRLPAPGGRLRGVVRGLLGRLDPRQAQGRPADGGDPDRSEEDTSA